MTVQYQPGEWTAWEGALRLSIASFKYHGITNEKALVAISSRAPSR